MVTTCNYRKGSVSFFHVVDTWSGLSGFGDPYAPRVNFVKWADMFDIF